MYAIFVFRQEYAYEDFMQLWKKENKSLFRNYLQSCMVLQKYSISYVHQIKILMQGLLSEIIT